jgi:hypothetical protein
VSEAPDIRIASGSPTPEELAAITAVLHGVLDELAADEATRTRSTTTAWARSQRDLRAPLRPGRGFWRSFG